MSPTGTKKTTWWGEARSFAGRDWTLVLSAALCVWAAPGCEAFSDVDGVARPQCSSDQSCDDGVFCNGPERCAPDDESADTFGCVPSSVEDLIDDGVDCTVDSCDEAQRRVIHDPVGCECVNSAQCQARFESPCLGSATCDPEFFVCQVELLAPGAPCDDGIACTAAATCDDQGQCVGSPDQSFCDDGIFCNGAETCDPSQGCVDGPSPLAQDDGVACTTAVCDEEAREVNHIPTADCECQSPQDCNTQSQCRQFVCDASTGFTCRLDEDNPQAPADTPCDDGLGCTELDACDGQGACIGEPVHSLCPGAQTCPEALLCVPDDAQADVDGCLACP